MASPSPTPELAHDLYKRFRTALEPVIVGQNDIIESLLVSLFSNGHTLLIGVPGLAKTLLAKTIADALTIEFKRIQFTPDLMPADILGSELLQEDKDRHLRFEHQKGPVFTNLLLADEINRTPPKTQSALLEAMQERKVTLAGISHELPKPFLVVATQNPIESEGVYNLPDAQRDRFMMKIVLDHPTADEELAILERMGITSATPVPEQVITLDELVALQARADDVFVDRSVAQYAVDLVQCTRDPVRFGLHDLPDLIGLGASPRATINLVRGARALAMLRGRTYATPQDVFDLAPEILRHRLLLTYDALAQDITTDDVINRMLAAVPAHWVSPKPNDAFSRS
jgi:MoxR-like ATPase